MDIFAVWLEESSSRPRKGAGCSKRAGRIGLMATAIFPCYATFSLTILALAIRYLVMTEVATSEWCMLRKRIALHSLENVTVSVRRSLAGAVCRPGATRARYDDLI